MNDPEHGFIVFLLGLILAITVLNVYFIIKLLEIIEGGL